MDRVKLVVLIPAGPAEQPEYVLDTIETIICFTAPSRRSLSRTIPGKTLANA
jgi:hypothetical protein